MEGLLVKDRFGRQVFIRWQAIAAIYFDDGSNSNGIESAKINLLSVEGSDSASSNKESVIVEGAQAARLFQHVNQKQNVLDLSNLA